MESDIKMVDLSNKTISNLFFDRFKKTTTEAIIKQEQEHKRQENKIWR
jgi:hypothetical protein